MGIVGDGVNPGYIPAGPTPALGRRSGCRLPCLCERPRAVGALSRAAPVIDVRSSKSHEIIVFAEFTRLVAYGPAGIKWETGRLSWEDLAITEVSQDYIKGEFWDIRTERTAEFAVKILSDRKARGGN